MGISLEIALTTEMLPVALLAAYFHLASMFSPHTDHSLDLMDHPSISVWILFLFLPGL